MTAAREHRPPPPLDAETEALRHGAGAFRAGRDVAGRAGARRRGLPAGPVEPGRGRAGGGGHGGLAAPRTRRQAVGAAAGDPHGRAGLRARCRPGLRRRRAGPPAPLPPALQGGARTARPGATCPCGARAWTRRRPACSPCWPSEVCWPCPSSGTAGPAWICWVPRTWCSAPDDDALPAGITACGADAVEACRIVSGIPAMGTELTEQDHRGRGGTGGAHGELHEGLLHGTGTGGPARRPRLERAPPPGRRGAPAGRRRPDPRHDAARRRHAPPATAPPRTRW